MKPEKISYKVFPSYHSEYSDNLDILKSKVKTLQVFSIIFGPSWFIGIFFSIFLAVILFVIAIILIQEHKRLNKELDKILAASNEAEFYAMKLNEVLEKSKEIIYDILPFYEQSAKDNLVIAKTDLIDRAISPFWDRIEETTKCLALFNEAVEQLNLNGEIYSKILDGKKHNFPSQFPYGTKISTPQSTLDDFNSIVRKAHTTEGFSNIWEHKKTQKILIVGFQSIVQAINSMSSRITSAISDLKHSISSEFREVRHIQEEQLKTFASSQWLMNNTLKEMDNKLYYLQYNKKPHTPFVRPLFD